jgi:hypothetical protein
MSAVRTPSQLHLSSAKLLLSKALQGTLGVAHGKMPHGQADLPGAIETHDAADEISKCQCEPWNLIGLELAFR